jgi:hypothetical protein
MQLQLNQNGELVLTLKKEEIQDLFEHLDALDANKPWHTLHSLWHLLGSHTSIDVRKGN